MWFPMTFFKTAVVAALCWKLDRLRPLLEFVTACMRLEYQSGGDFDAAMKYCVKLTSMLSDGMLSRNSSDREPGLVSAN